MAWQDDLDTLKEAQEIMLDHLAIYQQCLRSYHSSQVKDRAFNMGDLVLCLIQKEKGHKLSSPWEDPYAIYQVL